MAHGAVAKLRQRLGSTFAQETLRGRICQISDHPHHADLPRQPPKIRGTSAMDDCPRKSGSGSLEQAINELVRRRLAVLAVLAALLLEFPADSLNFLVGMMLDPDEL